MLEVSKFFITFNKKSRAFTNEISIFFTQDNESFCVRKEIPAQPPALVCQSAIRQAWQSFIAIYWNAGISLAASCRNYLQLNLCNL